MKYIHICQKMESGIVTERGEQHWQTSTFPGRIRTEIPQHERLKWGEPPCGKH